MNEPSELDIAQLKFDMRQMYTQIGFAGAIRVLNEMIIGARVLAEVMLEERIKNGN